VLDHLAGLRAGLEPAHAAWDALRRLADEGAWVKLSGWYRLGATQPYEALHDTIGLVHRLLPDRCVWGSDWPHTAFAADAMPAYNSTWLPVVRALGAETARRLRLRQPPLYR
jgi:predicted TIM-barrel fold metal-dependent hydrolase